MLKRICVLVCVLLVCFSCALPAFAFGSGSSDSYFYSAFPIDVIRLNDGEEAGSFTEWPFNVVSQDVHYDSRDVFWFSSFATVLAPRSKISGEMILADANSFTLISHLSYLDSGSFFKLSAGDYPTDITFKRIRIEYDLVGVEQYDTSGFYHGTFSHVSYDSSMADGIGDVHELDVISHILKAYKQQYGKDLTLGTTRMLQNLRITVDFFFDSDPNVYRGIGVELNADNNPGQVLLDWVDYLNIHSASPIGEFDPLSWLVDIAEAFLQLELFPGFTLDTLLNIAIISAVVLVIIKIVS